jgi:diacylglycerol kinase
MIHFMQTRAKAISHALEGWRYVLQTQRNTWVHASVSIAVIVVCFWLGLSTQDWAIIIFTIALVWAAEFINTSLEVLADLVQPDEDPLVKISKDVSAAAVLITAGTSIIIGILIIGPPLWAKLQLLLGR